jgi:cytochrome c oxidase assembly protein subunit 15
MSMVNTESASPAALPTSKIGSPRRWALAVAITIFPLIWMGGLVTTHDAGMAVPDWPGTYGYNLLAYPISTWLSGPFDLFVEHGHRLLGALTGMLAIGLVASCYLSEASSSLKRWSIIVLVAITLQGALGGIRVLQVNRVMAMVHGCTAALVFALACYVVTLASARAVNNHPSGQRGLARLAKFLTVIAFLQLILGASLRHLNINIKPSIFMALTHTHLTVATLLTLGILLLLTIRLATSRRYSPALPVSGVFFLFFLVLVQIFLGCLTWYVNYALPWDGLSSTLSAHVNHLKGLWETTIVTAHQAVGSLILVSLFLFAIRTQKPGIHYSLKTSSVHQPNSTPA